MTTPTTQTTTTTAPTTTTDAADVRVEHHGSIWILQPLTAAARAWITAHVAEDAQWWAGGLVVEPRYVHDLVVAMRDAGLEVR